MKSKTRGGANPKMHKYPRVLDYIEAHHPKYYKVIDDLAAHNAFTPRRGHGITVLLPDAAYIKKMQNTVESKTPEEAADMIYSLGIPMLLETPQDWSSNKDSIANLLGKQIKVSSVKSDKITLANGSELVPDKDFRPFDRFGPQSRGNMAVWKLKGEINYKDAPDMKPKKGGVHKKRGGNSTVNDQLIFRFVEHVERLERNAVREASSENNGLIDSCKLKVLANYHKEITRRAEKGDPVAEKHCDYFREVCPHILGGIEAGFYLVFSCRQMQVNGVMHNGMHDSILLCDIIGDDPMNSTLLRACSKPRAYLTSVAQKFKDRKLSECVENRMETLSYAVRKSTPGELVNLVHDFVNKSYPEGMQNGPLKDYYRTNPNMKLLVEEFKLACLHNWTWLRQAPELSVADRETNYNDFMNSIRDTYGNANGRIVIINPESRSILLKWSQDSEMVGQGEITFLEQHFRPDGFLSHARFIEKYYGAYSGGDDHDDYSDYNYRMDGEHDYKEHDEPVSRTALEEFRHVLEEHGMDKVQALLTGEE